MPFIERDASTKFHFEDLGTRRPPLLFLHGISCDLHDFDQLLAAFQAKHRVVAVDLRGHGKSSPAPSDGLTIGDYVSDVEWLCRALELDRPVVIGHSLGGVVGVELARKSPSLLAGLALLDASVCMPAAAWKAFAPVLEGLHTDDWRAPLLGLIGGFGVPSRNPDKHQYLLDRASAAPQAIFSRAFDSVAQWDANNALASCQLPLLYLASMLPVDEETLHRLAPNARLERLSAGHYPHIESPNEVIAIVDSFLKRV
ncbi:MAG: alpha/beta hydrolase [Myxococcales bacterium]